MSFVLQMDSIFLLEFKADDISPGMLTQGQITYFKFLQPYDEYFKIVQFYYFMNILDACGIRNIKFFVSVHEGITQKQDVLSSLTEGNVPQDVKK